MAIKLDKTARVPKHFVPANVESFRRGKLPDGTTFDDSGTGWDKSLIKNGFDQDGRGTIDHREWMNRRSNGLPVGFCRRCGEPMYPDAPYEGATGAPDYEAVCSDAHVISVDWETETRYVNGCGASMVAPGGRIMVSATARGRRKRAQSPA